ncbi:ATP-binding cassette domain-containing protein [Agromyces sp. CFH 90414]|uniref:ATP-binding cassette domain-containing protein n=1 Tax=Agromyces agglutinans TaxID=2662258 RepID=A0A6I2F1Z1_9MICO|nr:amino acid ABC transporter ATP-binding protein [Agromyces agglutinans]MRG59495.1 ATP-binding cassette domain-containing protein [Agromyces agglutinans]
MSQPDEASGDAVPEASGDALGASGDALAPQSAPDDSVLVRARGIRKTFGGNEVLRGVDLEVRRGEVVALIGPSGSGKTTVLRSLNGLETPDAGELEIVGGPRIDFAAQRPLPKAARYALRDRSAMVFQHHNLFPHMTVLQNVIEGPVQVRRMPRADATAHAEALLARVGLAEKRDAYPFELSGGQQQRVGIVRALALEPDLLLFDEPTSALDPELVGEVLRVIKELADEGWTMVIVTHELAFARQVADEVVFLDGGVIVERGAPATLFTAPREERTRRFLDRLLHPFE